MGMSLEEALKILKEYSFEQHHINGSYYPDFLEAVDRAILSMEREQKEILELKGENNG